MSPENPRLNNAESSKDEKDKDGKKKKNYRFLPNTDSSSAEGTSQPAAENANKPRTLEDIIAEARRRKAEAAKSDTTETEKVETSAPQENEQAVQHDDQHTESDVRDDPDQSSPENEASDLSEQHEKDEVEEYAEAEQDLPHWRELEPNEFSGGEVVHIRNEEAVEGEVNLHDTPPAKPEDVSETEATGSENLQQPYVFTRQPEQQHQAGSERPQPPRETASQASAAETQPEPLEEQGNERESDNAVNQPETTNHTYAAEIIPPVAGTGEQGRPATKQEVEDALHYTAKANAQRGVLSGLFVGTYLANRRIKRRQKRETKELARQSRELKDQSNRLQQLEQATHAQSVKTERRFAVQNKEIAEQRKPVEAKLEQNEHNKEKPKTLQIQSAEAPITVPENHRLERSVWHTIEVDKRTGKAVENQSFAYGREYYREKAHESLADSPAEPASTLAGATAVRALIDQPNTVTEQTASTQASSSSSKNSQDIKAKLSVLASRIVKDGKSTTGPIWPWIITLVVIVVLLGLLIR